MNNQPIGILDSGVGGLSIWQEIVRQLPHESIVYIADSKNCPYGNKTASEIYELTKRIIDFLLSQRVKLVVVACNSATVSCLEKLRSAFPSLPIVGIVPVVKTASEQSAERAIGVLSTTVTAKSAYQKNLIKQWANGCKVVNIGTDTLVPFVEKGEVASAKLTTLLEKELQPFKLAGIDTLALGCSHYPFLKATIQEVLGPEVILLDSGGAIARQVKRVLSNNKQLTRENSPSYTFYTSGDVHAFLSTAQKLLGSTFATYMQSTQQLPV